MARYRDPQPRVVENYSYLFNLRSNICKSWMFKHNSSDLINKQKNDKSRDQQDKG